MLVFKFGGASVKDADGIVNLANVVKSIEDNQLLIVVSAMGKTTNALEKLQRHILIGDDDLHDIFEEIKKYHYDIIEQLFEPSDPYLMKWPILLWRLTG